MSPKISVIVAVYNVEKYLAKCLDSLLRQTYDGFEVIVVDDGSTDATMEVCARYKKADRRIKVVRQENQGISAARNVGLKESVGEYVVFVDGDDYVSDRFIETLWERIEGVDIAVCGYINMPGGRVERLEEGVASGEEMIVRLLTRQENILTVLWNKMYRKRVFEGVEFPMGKQNEDTLTMYKILANAERVALIDEVLYYYIRRRGSIMDTIRLPERLDLKMLAAREARQYFANNERLSEAAEVAELLATFSYLDNIIDGKLKCNDKKFWDWMKDNKRQLLRNKLTNWKLKLYIYMSTCCSGLAYKMFRKIKH